MPPVVFESAIPASERPQTHAFHRVAAEINLTLLSGNKKLFRRKARSQITVDARN